MQPINLRNLFDNGLLFEINRRVLHPLGLALALQWDDESPQSEPSGVILYKTDDPDGIVFSPQVFREGEERFQKFLERIGGHKLAERETLVGFIEQRTPEQGGPEPN